MDGTQTEVGFTAKGEKFFCQPQEEKEKSSGHPGGVGCSDPVAGSACEAWSPAAPDADWPTLCSWLYIRSRRAPTERKHQAFISSLTDVLSLSQMSAPCCYLELQLKKLFCELGSQCERRGI